MYLLDLMLSFRDYVFNNIDIIVKAFVKEFQPSKNN
jgi:hypothetical protein